MSLDTTTESVVTPVAVDETPAAAAVESVVVSDEEKSEVSDEVSTEDGADVSTEASTEVSHGDLTKPVEPALAPGHPQFEDMFPTLGNGSTSEAPSPAVWNIRGAIPPPVRTTVQNMFDIPNEHALKLTKTEVAKIILELKKTYKVSIDTTVSAASKSRHIVVSGKPSDVEKTKRELARRLAKPVTIEFTVPAKTRSAIIGAAGKTINPIRAATHTSIDVERQPEDADEDTTIKVTITGDEAGARLAKAKIIAIVREETKNLSTKVVVPQEVLAFVKASAFSSETVNVSGPDRAGVVKISGLREDVLAKKAEVAAHFETLAANIKTQVMAIPAGVHHLIDAGEILEKFDVLVKFPTTKGDTSVSFIGPKENIQKAIDAARAQTKSYVVLDMNIASAFGKNITHCRALGAYFKHSGTIKKIVESHNASVKEPAYPDLADSETKSVIFNIFATQENKDGIPKIRQEIVAIVNSLPPTRALVVTDITSFFAKRIASVTAAAAKEGNVYVIPMSQLSGGASNEIFLIALNKEDEEFAPAQEDIDARLQAVNSALDELRSAQADLKETVLDVPADKQQFIEGPKGFTLKRLLQTIDNIVIKLHSDGKTESADQVYLLGSKSAVAQAEKEINALLEDAADLKDLNGFQADLKVPVNALARLIGKGGANLHNLEEKYTVKINVEKEQTDNKSQLTITGYKLNVKEAEQEISQLAKRFADEITSTIIVPEKYRSSLVGTGGKNLKKLEEKYHVAINFVSGSEDVIIRGPSRGVPKAEKELKDLLDYEIENGHTKEISVPNAALARIIGRNGENINRLEADAGVSAKVTEDGKTSGTALIRLTGSRKGLSDAEKAIKSIVTEIENTVTVELEVDPKYFRDILGPRGSTKQQIIDAAGDEEDKDYRKLLQIPESGSGSNKIVSTGPKKLVDNIIAQVKKLVEEKESSVTETVEIPKEKHRLLIGPAGLTRRSIEEEFSVQLSIPRVESNSDKITLTGLPENIEKAKAKCAELTVDDWKAVVEVPSNLHGAVSERGEFIRRLRSEYNVEVEHGPASGKARNLASKVPGPPSSARGSEEEKTKFTTVEDAAFESTATIPWRLKCDDDEAVAKAEKEIKDAVEKWSKADTTGFYWVKEPRSVFNKIIGPQGSRLNALRSKSNTSIYVPRNSDKHNDVIVIRGTKEDVEKAHKLLAEQIEKK